ncbi:MAG TPA: metal-dependent hydrolase, partial [Phycisphaerae bacterium]|nr:metal-dependent hydrolase [Phycisphaerae bacterium]
MILDMLRNERRIKPERVLVDHAEEHTIRHILDAGYWCGLTLYPITKCTPQRAADMVERYGTQRLCVNSAGDWGPSNPMAVPAFMLEMRLRGHTANNISQVVYENPLQFFKQSARFAYDGRV